VADNVSDAYDTERDGSEELVEMRIWLRRGRPALLGRSALGGGSIDRGFDLYPGLFQPRPDLAHALTFEPGRTNRMEQIAHRWFPSEVGGVGVVSRERRRRPGSPPAGQLGGGRWFRHDCDLLLSRRLRLRRSDPSGPGDGRRH